MSNTLFNTIILSEFKLIHSDFKLDEIASHNRVVLTLLVYVDNDQNKSIKYSVTTYFNNGKSISCKYYINLDLATNKYRETINEMFENYE